MKNTPTPWEVRINKDGSVRICTTKGGHVARTQNCVGIEKDLANARLIVRAVNAYTKTTGMRDNEH